MCAAFYAALNTPTLTLMAEQGLRQKGELESAIQALSGIPDCDLRTVPGSHHAHMEEGADGDRRPHHSVYLRSQRSRDFLIHKSGAGLRRRLSSKIQLLRQDQT